MIQKPLPYWRRDGTECDQEEFFRLQGDKAYRLIAEEAVGDRKVTTVWLGHDYEFVMGFHERPRPFGTLLWSNKDGYSTFPPEEKRYETETAAREGHEKIVSIMKGSRS